METNSQNPNFRLKAVAEFLHGEHHFYIPSYQRGYRWDHKQVEDLLKDIWDFAKNARQGDFYCLQPIVVKSKTWKNKDNNSINGWEVIDGQQRLTSLLLLLKYLKRKSSDTEHLPENLYSISYQTRPELNFDNVQKHADIDSYHVSSTVDTIEKWFNKNKVRKSKIEEVLFYDDSTNDNSQKDNKEPEEPKVKFIWYVAENEDDIEAIKIFNNLNRGKIRLTNAELIKALFILKTKNGKEKLNINELAFEWNEMENTLHDDKIWYFLANKEYNPATRIDIVFDFLTEKGNKNDSDFSYRKFQDLYDNPEDTFWKNREVTNFTDAWKKVKEVFQTFIYWFEDKTLYHYIGYLVYYGIPLRCIYSKCNGKSKTDIVEEVQKLIKTKVLKGIKKDFDDFNYAENINECKKLLLFFNIETCVKQQPDREASKIFNLDSLTYYKFPFALFKLYSWDVEHIDSQTENPLIKVKDKIIWLGYIENIGHPHKAGHLCNRCSAGSRPALVMPVNPIIKAEQLSALHLSRLMWVAENIVCKYKGWEDLVTKSRKLKESLEKENKDEGGEFEKLYKKILKIIQQDGEQNYAKDTIGNLTLLDAGTNRGYGNALFPTKRRKIIKKDKEGLFIPICTKNLFLKYYTEDDKNSSQWKNRWTKDDREAYLKAMHETIDFILE